MVATLWWPCTEVAYSPLLTLDRCQPWERGGGVLRGAAGPRKAHTLLGQEQTRPLFFQTLGWWVGQVPQPLVVIL